MNCAPNSVTGYYVHFTELQWNEMLKREGEKKKLVFFFFLQPATANLNRNQSAMSAQSTYVASKSNISRLNITTPESNASNQNLEVR